MSWKYVCDNSTLRLKCDANQTLQFSRAKYGRDNRHVNCNRTTDSTCDMKNVIDVVKMRCGMDVSYCNVIVNNSWLPGYCPNLHKYLRVKYQCRSESTTTQNTEMEFTTKAPISETSDSSFADHTATYTSPKTTAIITAATFKAVTDRNSAMSNQGQTFLGAGQIAGVAAAGIVGLLLLLLICVIINKRFIRRKTSSRELMADEKQNKLYEMSGQFNVEENDSPSYNVEHIYSTVAGSSTNAITANVQDANNDGNVNLGGNRNDQSTGKMVDNVLYGMT